RASSVPPTLPLLLTRRPAPPTSTLFPYTTLFRSRPYSPGGVLNALTYSTKGRKPRNTSHSSFIAWTTRVSNPDYYPCFRTSASVLDQRIAFATDVPPNIYAFHSSTWNSTLLFYTQVPQFLMTAHS